MRLRLVSLAIIAAGCSGGVAGPDAFTPGSAFSATITDHADVIAEASEDRMFLFEVTESDALYPLSELTLLVELDASGGFLGAAITLEDDDGDGMLGAGDTILASEIQPGHYAEEDAGSTLEVSLRHMRGTADERTLFEGTWHAQ